MSDTAVLISFGVGYVFSGLLLFGMSLGPLSSKVKLIKFRPRDK
jgi:hypothetical protein